MIQFQSVTMVMTVLLLMATLCGCPNGKDSSENPIMPSVEHDSNQTITEYAVNNLSHNLLGSFDVSIDLETSTVEISPDRELMTHFDITSWLQPPNCYDCISIQIITFDQIEKLLTLEVTLKNPFENLDGYCVRGIFISDNPDHILENADGLTPLWDTHDPVQINPFLTFPAHEMFEPIPLFEGGETHVREYQLRFGDPPGFLQIKYRIDASFPEGPEEPAWIDHYWTGGDMYPFGGYHNFTIGVHDWSDDVTRVTLDSRIFNNKVIDLSKITQGYNWHGTVWNDNWLPAGDYRCLVTAWSENSGDLALYKYVTLTVDEGTTTFNLNEVTPPGLNFAPSDIYIDGDYAYVGGKYNGLVIFDISDTSSPQHIKTVPIHGDWLGMAEAHDVVVSDGFAFVACKDEGAAIIDVDPPADAHVVNSLVFEDRVNAVGVDENYFYIVACYDQYSDGSFFEIYSKENLSSLELVASVPGVYGACTAMEITDDFAYCMNGSGLQIFDIDPPAEASLVSTTTVGLYNNFTDIDVVDGYAYISDSFSNFRIYDVDPVQSPVQVFSDDIDGFGGEVLVDGAYAYVCQGGEQMKVYDISDPASATQAGVLEFGTSQRSMEIAPDGRFVLVGSSRLQVLEVTPPSTANIVKSVFTPDSPGRAILLDGDKAYYCGFGTYGYQTYDISDPQNVEIISAEYGGIGIPGWIRNGDHAYINGDDFFKIIDVSIPGNPVEVKNLELNDVNSSQPCVVRGGYAYCPRFDDGLMIIDVDPPADAHVVTTVPDLGDVYDVDITDDYAYVVSINDANGGVKIIDITPPEDASHIDSFATDATWLRTIIVNGDYLYLSVSNEDMRVYDISDPLVPVQGDSIEWTHSTRDSWIFGNVLYTGQSNTGFRAHDVTDPSNPEIQCIFPNDISAHWLEVTPDGYAYVVDGYHGLRIFDLW